MAHCVVCSSAIIDDDQYYMMCNIGPELSTIIKQNLGHEISEDGVICGPCFENVQDVTSMSSSNIKQEDPLLDERNTNVCVYCQSSMFNKPYQMVADGPQKQFISERISPRIIPDGSRVCYSCWKDIQDSLQAQGITCTTPVNTNICVWCQVSLGRRRKHLIPDGPERDEILKQIHPREIPDGSRVCYSCWKRIQVSLQAQGIPCTPLVDTNICVWCQVSLAKRRRHSIPDGPERDEIIQRIHPREIPPGGQVCYACWIRACRNLKRAMDESDPSQRDNCVWCGISLFRRKTRTLTGSEREKVAARIYPREMPHHAHVCSNCFARAQEIIKIEQGHVIDVETKNPAMTLDNFSHTTSSSSHCFVPGCHNPERHIVPDYLRKRILTSQRVFVTENARICVEHKSVFNWEFLDQKQFSNTFTKLEMESMLELSIKEIQFNFDFENFEVINDTIFKYWTGVDKEKYVRILDLISPAFESRDKPKTALGVYLIKVKTGDTHERIASLLGINKSTVSRILEKARTALLKVGQENIE